MQIRWWWLSWNSSDGWFGQEKSMWRHISRGSMYHSLWSKRSVIRLNINTSICVGMLHLNFSSATAILKAPFTCSRSFNISVPDFSNNCKYPLKQYQKILEESTTFWSFQSVKTVPTSTHLLSQASSPTPFTDNEPPFNCIVARASPTHTLHSNRPESAGKFPARRTQTSCLSPKHALFIPKHKH